MQVIVLQDSCCVGWVDPFIGNSVSGGWQVPPSLGWTSGPGYCACGMHGLVTFNFSKIKMCTRACIITWPQSLILSSPSLLHEESTIPVKVRSPTPDTMYCCYAMYCFYISCIVLVYISVSCFTADIYRNSYLVLLCMCNAQLKQHLTFYSLFDPSQLMSNNNCKKHSIT